MRALSTVDPVVIQARLTPDRLQSYMAASGRDIGAAVALYEWNNRVGGAFHEALGLLEVVFRNALDAQLEPHAVAKGWSCPWYLATGHLFPGRRGSRMVEAVDDAPASA